MKEFGEFYNSREIRSLFEQIVPVYQIAFAGEPWFEVSKCADEATLKRCVGGFSSLPVGVICGLCGNRLTRPAYEKEELINKFELIAETRPTSWYMEKSDKGITLAVLAWKETPIRIVKERYPDVDQMASWMEAKLGSSPIIWLDEVFADRNKKPKKNLSNFGAMCRSLGGIFQADLIAYRTINEKMIAVAKRDFGENALSFGRNTQVPDRRDFVVIKLGGNQL